MNTETLRLYFRPVELSDAPSLFSYRSDEHTNQYQGWIPQNSQEVDDFIKNKISREFNQIGSWYQLAMILKESDTLIGDIGLHFLENNEVEIGITIAQEHQGKGYGSEGLKKIIDLLFMDWNKHQIKGSVDPRNKASIALLLKLGFQKEYFKPRAFFLRGKWVDDLQMVLHHKNWSP